MVIFIDILKFILLIPITFLSCQVITNGKKRISYIGTILICFSTAVLEYINSGLVEALLFGQLIFISVDRLFSKEKNLYLYILMISLRNFRIFITFKYQFSNIYRNYNNYFNYMEIVKI